MNETAVLSENEPELSCPLCKGKDFSLFSKDKKRDFFQCGRCRLIFVPPFQYLSEEEEKAIYDLHQNSPDHQGYRDFLGRLFIPMQKRLKRASRGLDFGSGPGPTLSVMFEEAGHAVDLYDHFYAKDPSVFENQYDFITATEVLEHLHAPKTELERLWSVLCRGGYLGIMTQCSPSQEAFPDWHYVKDYSHVCFYSPETFQWISGWLRAEIEFSSEGAVIYHKK